MKNWFKNHKRATAVIVAVVVIFIVIRVWRDAGEKNDSEGKAFKVIAQTIGTGKLEETIPATGSFEALVSVEVVPEVSGQLQRLQLADGTPVDVGVAVKKGEVIAVIDREVYLAQLAQCQAALDAGKVALADADREKKRMVKLFEAGSATEQAKDKAVTAAELAAAQLKQAEAALAAIKITVDKATIESPVDGLIAKKYVDEGNMVGPGAPLVRIVQIETLKVVGSISERHLPRLVAGKTPVLIATDAYPQDEFEGVVYRVGVAVDPVTRTGEVEIRVPNQDGRLKPGMFARMTMVISHRQCVVVPDSALIREYNNEYVFVAQGGKAYRRKLKLGLSEGQFYEVLEGASAGDMVITHGQTQLKDGQAVEVVQGVGK